MTVVDTYVLIMSCEVVWLLQYYVRMYFFQLVLRLSEKKCENLQRHKKYKFENTRFEKFRLSLTKLQESSTSSGRFLSVEWTPEDMKVSRICEKITAFFMALRDVLTNFKKDSIKITTKYSAFIWTPTHVGCIKTIISCRRTAYSGAEEIDSTEKECWKRSSV